MKKGVIVLAVLFVAFSMLAAGCSKQLSAQETLAEAIEASMEVESARFASTLKIGLDVPEELVRQNPDLAMALPVLNQSEWKLHGVIRQEPEMQAELIVEANLKGDFSINFTVPMFITEDRVWVKVPEIPMPAGFIPEEVAGKYILLDLRELQAMSGSESAEFGPQSVDVETARKLVLELYGALSGSFDEETYFTKSEVKEGDLPEGADAETIVTFTVTEEQFDQAAAAFVERALPQMLDILSNAEYAEMLGVDPAKLEQTKKEVEDESRTLQEDLAKLKEQFTVHELSLASAVNRDQLITYQKLALDMSVREEGRPHAVRVKLALDLVLSEINENPEFQYGRPADDQTVTLEQIQEAFEASFGTGLE